MTPETLLNDLGVDHLDREDAMHYFRRDLTFMHPNQCFQETDYFTLVQDMCRTFSTPNDVFRARDERAAIRSRDACQLPDRNTFGPYRAFREQPMVLVVEMEVRPHTVLQQRIPAYPRYKCCNGMALYTIRFSHQFTTEELHQRSNTLGEFGLALDTVPSVPGNYYGTLGLGDHYLEGQGWNTIAWDDPTIRGPQLRAGSLNDENLHKESDLVPVDVPTEHDFLQWIAALPNVLASLVHQYWSYEHVPQYVLIVKDIVANRTRSRTSHKRKKE